MSHHKILIGLCTYRRPQMLRECLRSLAKLKLPNNSETCCYIINNDTTPLSGAIIKEFSEIETPISFLFSECLERGIPQARNIILEKADAESYDYCLFLDDDEFAEEDWLVQILNCQKETSSHAIQGQVKNHYENRPWLLAPLLKETKFDVQGGHLHKFVSTCNVLLTRQLYASDGFQLRFDQKLALTGGSDKELFLRAQELHNIKITFCANAVVNETIPASRTTIQWHFIRLARIESNRFILKQQRNGKLHTILYMLPTALLNLIKSLVYSITTILFLIVPKQSARQFLKLLKSSAKLWGYLSSITGFHINAYKTTTGS